MISKSYMNIIRFCTIFLRGVLLQEFQGSHIWLLQKNQTHKFVDIVISWVWREKSDVQYES